MTERDEGIGWELGGLLLAFVQRPRNWLVLARNFVPVVGVFLLGWSGQVTMLFYWLDGFFLLGLLIAAMLGRGMAELRKTRTIAIGQMVFQGTIGFALFFGLLSIPYWMVFMELDLAKSVWLVSESTVLTVLAVSVVVADFVAAFQRGGYFGMPIEDLRKLGASEMEQLATRGVAMVVLTWWTHGVLLAPLFAVVLTAVETWPQVRQDWQRLDATPVA